MFEIKSFMNQCHKCLMDKWSCRRNWQEIWGWTPSPETDVFSPIHRSAHLETWTIWTKLQKCFPLQNTETIAATFEKIILRNLRKIPIQIKGIQPNSLFNSLLLVQSAIKFMWNLFPLHFQPCSCWYSQNGWIKEISWSHFQVLSPPFSFLCRNPPPLTSAKQSCLYNCNCFFPQKLVCFYKMCRSYCFGGQQMYLCSNCAGTTALPFWDQALGKPNKSISLDECRHRLYAPP